MKSSCKVSIIIKALNEEAKIARAIESALAAVSQLGGEVILADSLSNDQTLDIAQNYPIKIMQLTQAKDRCCGIGPQLGYQIAEGEFVYILDGDMQMLPDFLEAAVHFLETNPDYAGVGGRVLEMNTDSLEFQARVERAADHMQAGEVDRLDMGGLYRKEAIESVGHFSNYNLHAYEELDLAVRLRAKNWKLHRLDLNAVKHWGHDVPPYELLKKRWRSGYIMGLGEAFRNAWGQPHFSLLIQATRETKIYLITLIWWLSMFFSLFTPAPLWTTLALFLLPFILMGYKKRSLRKAAFSVVSWSFNAAGLVKGFLQKPKPLNKMIAARNLTNPNQDE